MVIAPLGQGATQAPQALQHWASSSGKATPPRRGRKRIAVSGQFSPHTRHSTPCIARQPAPISTRSCQGSTSGLVRCKAAGSQWSRHSAQKVHSPREKSTSGKPPSPRIRIADGQCSTQASQRVQMAVNACSASAHGGRIAARCPLPALRRKPRLETDNTSVMAASLCFIHQTTDLKPCWQTGH